MGKRWEFVGPADRRIWLMSRMVNRLGVTLGDLSQANPDFPLNSAIRTCLACTHANECEAWLSHANLAYAADAPGFCPNAKLFRQLRS
jgi:hypothetical protein